MFAAAPPDCDRPGFQTAASQAERVVGGDGLIPGRGSRGQHGAAAWVECLRWRSASARSASGSRSVGRRRRHVSVDVSFPSRRRCWSQPPGPVVGHGLGRTRSGCRRCSARPWRPWSPDSRRRWRGQAGSAVVIRLHVRRDVGRRERGTSARPGRSARRYDDLTDRVHDPHAGVLGGFVVVGGLQARFGDRRAAGGGRSRRIGHHRAAEAVICGDRGLGQRRARRQVGVADRLGDPHHVRGQRGQPGPGLRGGLLTTDGVLIVADISAGLAESPSKVCVSSTWPASASVSV